MVKIAADRLIRNKLRGFPRLCFAASAVLSKAGDSLRRGSRPALCALGSAGRILSVLLATAVLSLFHGAALADVAHDRASESHTSGTTGSTNQASFSWTHTPGGTPRGVLVYVYTYGTSTINVTGVTYGGVAMTAVAGGAAADTAGEPGRVDTYFLGASIPTGAQTIVVSRVNNGRNMYAAAATQIAATDTEVTGMVLLEQNGTFSEQSVDDGTIGSNSQRYAGAYAGGSNNLAAGASSSILNNFDLGNRTFNMARETTPGQGARNVGFSYNTSDDRAAVHLAVRELPAVPTVATNSATGIGGSGATLNGTVSSNRASTTVTFEYGLTTAYGSTVTAAQSPLAANASSASVSAAVTGLVCNTTYHFRVVGANIAGTSNGGNSSFTTSVCTTTIGTGTDPAPTTIAPGAVATDVDTFTLQTTGGIEAVSTVTVNLSSNNGVGRLAITDNADSELGFTTTPATGANVITVTGMSATTTLTTFKVRITPKSHAAMPVPPGGSYVITAPVTAWAGPYPHAGSDTNTNALTIDNLSPAAATAVSASAGMQHANLYWTTSASSDYSTSVVLRWTGGSAGAEVPAEGVTYTNGTAIGTATVACVRSGDASSTAINGADGAGTGGCSATALAVNQAYTYKIFQQDAYGNYDTGVTIATITTYPALGCFTDGFTGADGSAPSSTDWSVNRVSGTFTPQIVGNRLRITDTSGNAATRATNKNLFPFGNNLVVAEFDFWAYGGSGADGISVNFSDPNTPSTGANNPPTTGGFGGSLGYANRDTGGICDVPGFTGGWVGVGIDEYGNYSNPTECRNGGPGSRPNAVSARGSGSGATSPSTSNYVYLTGTSALGANGVSSGDGVTPYRYRITLDSITDINKVMVKVEQDKTGGGYLPLFSYDLKAAITAGTQAALPSQLQLTFTGSTGGSTNNHEIDNVSVCAASVIPPGGGLHHLEIQHGSGTGLTCLASTLTIRACADAPCTTLYTGGVVGTLNATGTPTVNWDGSTGGAAGAGFVIPSGSSSVTKKVQVATAGNVVFGLASATPVPTNTTTCDFGSPACTFTAESAGFIFSSAAGGGIATLPTQVAGTSSATYFLRAVKTNTTTQACEAALTGASSVNFGYECNNPTTCYAGGNLMSVNGGAATTIARNDNGSVVSYLPVNMTFDANGNAPFTFNYSDVGQVKLWATKAAGGSLLSALSGSSNAFVVKPGGFVLSNIKQTAAPQLANPAAASAAGAKFVKAGESFTLSASATTTPASGATVTPNYGRELAPESIKLTSTLIAPGGGAAGSFSGSLGAFANGTASGSAFNWSEVGIISLTPSVGDGDYLGAGDTTGTASGNIGRFYPDHFDTVVTSQGAPTAFAYSGNPVGPVRGQPFTVAVTARNASGAPTANYAYGGGTGYARDINLSVPVGGGTGQIYIDSVAGGSGAVPAAKFTGAVAGEGKVNYSDASGRISFVFNALPQSPQAIQIHAEDADTVTSAGANGAITIRHGRLRVFNAFGSEKADLGLPVRAEYWSGNSWVINSDDSFTSVPAASVALAAYSGSLADPTNFGPAHVAGVTLVNGQGSIVLAKPAPAATGSIDIAINLGSTATDLSCLAAHPATTGAGMPWLRSINGSCAATYDRDPSARASFGIFSPETRKTIHMRELF